MRLLSILFLVFLPPPLFARMKLPAAVACDAVDVHIVEGRGAKLNAVRGGIETRAGFSTT